MELRKGAEKRFEFVEKIVKEAPSRKSFEALKKENAETFEELKEKLVAHAKELEELKEKNEKLEENDKALNEKLEENDKALNEKLVAHAKELEELKEKNEKLGEFVGQLRTNIMKHLKFFREVSKRELERELEEMMQNITNDLQNIDKRIAGVSKASIKRDNEIKLAIAAPTGAAKEEEWIEQL